MSLTFFSVSDRQLESSINFHDFEKSLYLNILFQKGILVPDVFFFISKYLAAHIERFSRKSFFEAALENGLVIPSFRNPAKASFEDVLFELRGAGKPQNAIQGLRYNAEMLASRLQLSAEQGLGYKYKTWPKFSIGERYKDLILRQLSRDALIQLPQNARYKLSDIQKLWDNTISWRQDVIFEAAEVSSQIQTSGPSPGIRRGEIYNTVARRLEMEVPEGGIHDVQMLLSAVRDNEELYLLLYNFLGWVNECYHLNLATSLESVPNSPRFVPPSGLMYEHLVPESSDTAKASIESLQTIELDIVFPSMEILRKIPGTELVSIVRDIGHGYQNALDAWNSNPTWRTEQALQDLLKKYSEELLAFVSDKYGYEADSKLKMVHGRTSKSDRVLLERIIKILEKGASVITTGVSDLIVEFGRSIFTGYKVYKDEPSQETVKLHARHNAPEVNFPD